MKSKKTPSKKSWLVYILRCKDKSYYTGITNDIEKRLAAHMVGTASRYTRARRPVKLLAKTKLRSRSDALRLEIKIKRMPKAKKLMALAAYSSR
jgi:putative endonuclease